MSSATTITAIMAAPLTNEQRATALASILTRRPDAWNAYWHEQADAAWRSACAAIADADRRGELPPSPAPLPPADPAACQAWWRAHWARHRAEAQIRARFPDRHGRRGGTAPDAATPEARVRRLIGSLAGVQGPVRAAIRVAIERMANPPRAYFGPRGSGSFSAHGPAS